MISPDRPKNTCKESNGGPLHVLSRMRQADQRHREILHSLGGTPIAGIAATGMGRSVTQLPSGPDTGREPLRLRLAACGNRAGPSGSSPSRREECSPIAMRMTRVTGRVSAGTLLYMPPEQLRGGKLSPASDVYSLTASLYECLAGHPPFHSGSVEY